MSTHRLRSTTLNRRTDERGAAMVLFMLSMILVIIPAIGLAIDGAIVFLVKAKLAAAVDAAALAGGRSINAYVPQSQNSGTAVTAAQNWFAANFPPGWMGASVVGGQPSVTLQATANSTQKLSVQATAVVPLFFMRILNHNSIQVSASAQASRRNVNIVLVLDRSGSMNSNIGGNACTAMKSSATNFMNMFTDNFDSMGMVTYSTNANSSPIDYPINLNFKTAGTTIKATIDQIGCSGGTNMTMGLQVAYQAIRSNGLASGLNVIVLFTDGQPNAMTGTSWPVRTSAADNNIRWDPWSTSSTISQAQPVPWAGPSPCNSLTLPTGIITVLFSSTPTPQVQGLTSALYDANSQVALNNQSGYLHPPGCYMTTNNYYGPVLGRADIAYIPGTDAYGNLTTGYKAVDLFPSGPYVNQIRIDEQLNGVVAASTNTADDQASKIRNDSTYRTVIYSIGLGGAPDMPIDGTLLERISNDPRSQIFDSSKPAGFFTYASDPSSLNEAFQMVASQILRLSQ